MVRGVFWNIIGMVAIALTMLVTIPIFLRYFGAERYGILATVWVFFGYFSVLDFGMGPAIINFLSRPEHADGEGASGVFWTAIFLNTLVGLSVAVLLIAIIVGIDAAGVFAPGMIRDELMRALPWLLLMLPVSLVYPILIGALDARQLFGLANMNQLLATMIGQALPLVAIGIVKPTLTVAIAGTVIGRLVVATLLLFVCIRKLGLIHLRFERGLVRPLMSFGGWVAASSGTGLVLETADRMVIASFLGGTAAAWYTIAYNIVTRVRTLPHAIARAAYPRVSADPAGGMGTLVVSARVMVLILIPVLAIGLVLIEPLCTLWIGAEASASVSPIARIMMIAIYVNAMAYIPLVALQARGNPEQAAKIHMIETPIFLIVMTLATWRYGVFGAVIAWAGRMLIDTIILLLVTGLKRILYVDVLVQPLTLLATMAVLWLWPDQWMVQAGAVALLLLVWLVVDSLWARRSANTLWLGDLFRWGLTMIRARQAAR